MKDIEINKRLAVKIGWKETSLMECHQAGRVFLQIHGKVFHYMDPSVYVPIKAQCLKPDEVWRSNDGWHYKYTSKGEVKIRSTDSLGKAVAMAVIGDSK